MGKIVKSSEKISQRMIGFHKRQLDFFKEYEDFSPDKLCRDLVDDQINLIDPNFLEKFDE